MPDPTYQLFTCGTKSAQTIQVSKDNRTIAITTTDEVQSIADRAVVSVGYTVYGIDQDSTYAEASKVSNAVVRALRDAGVKAEAIESREQNLTAIDDNDKTRYSKGIRFVATQSWGVDILAKDAAETLHLAITAGANNIRGIDWQSMDDQTLESEAATKALVHAQQIAEGMAKGLKVTLGPLSMRATRRRPEAVQFPTTACNRSRWRSRARQAARDQPSQDLEVSSRLRRLLFVVARNGSKPRRSSASDKLEA